MISMSGSKDKTPLQRNNMGENIMSGNYSEESTTACARWLDIFPHPVRKGITSEPMACHTRSFADFKFGNTMTPPQVGHGSKLAGRINRKAALEDDLLSIQRTVNVAGGAAAAAAALTAQDSFGADPSIPPPPDQDTSEAALRRQVSEGTAALYLVPPEAQGGAAGVHLDLMAAAVQSSQRRRNKRKGGRRRPPPPAASAGSAPSTRHHQPPQQDTAGTGAGSGVGTAELLRKMKQPEHSEFTTAGAPGHGVGTLQGQVAQDANTPAQADLLMSVACANGWSPNDSLVVGHGLGATDVPLPQRACTLGDDINWIAQLSLEAPCPVLWGGLLFPSPLEVLAAAKMSK